VTEGAASAAAELLPAVQSLLEGAGVVAFAVSGALVAGRRRMDLVGVIVLGMIVAVGGGTLRDMVLGRTVFWISDPTYVVLAGVAALVSVPLFHVGALARAEQFRLVSVIDAAGMALFVVTGTGIALAAGANPIAATLVGVLNGIAGGIIRDVLATRLPEVLTDGRFYATAALAGAALTVLLTELRADPLAITWLPVVVIFGIRVGSLRYGWGMPRFEITAADIPGPRGSERR
jgi:uncharacterized membrane protein YeiH